MLKEGFLFTFISAFMALFPVANPVGAGFLVNGLLSGLNDEDRRSIIRKIGNSGSIVINKMVAFFTFCVGVQIVVTGIAKLFNLHV